MATLGNPKNTIAVLQKYQFNFQKKFGQNFLIDTGILEKSRIIEKITPLLIGLNIKYRSHYGGLRITGIPQFED